MQHMGSRYIQLMDALDRDLDMCFGNSKEGMNEGMAGGMMEMLQMLQAMSGLSKSGGTGGKGGNYKGGPGGGGGGWDKSRAPTGKILRVQGLPFSASRQDVQKFFTGYVLSGRIHLQTDSFGEFTGIAFVEFGSNSEAQRAFNQKNFQYMGSRYIELMEARDLDIEKHFGAGYAAMNGGFGRARPY